MSHATSVGDKQKQTEDRNVFHIQYCVRCVISIKEIISNVFCAIKDLLQCRMSSAYCQEEKPSTKRVHLIAQVHSTEVKWSIKPYIVPTKTFIKALRQKLF